MKLSDPRSVQKIGFLLLPNFAMMSYASAVEPLRAANLIAGRELYEIVALSADGKAVASSVGVPVPCSDLVSSGQTCHTIFVCAGGSPRDWISAEHAYGLLRRFARQGIRIGGISSGAYILASAGLLDNRDFTIHWEHSAALKEAFPHLSPRQARFVLAGDRITCAGGIAPLDMMHAMILERMGPHFARRVSDWYLHTLVSEPAAPQRASAPERFGTHNPALLTVLEKMETSVEKPLGRSDMAKLAGVSIRHLDRLFSNHLGSRFVDTYRNIRLDHARRLVEQSPLSIAEIGFATGFSSASHFSRAFKTRFNMTPHAMRQRISSE